MRLTDLEQIAEWFWDFEDVALFERGLPVPVNLETLQESWRTALGPADPPKAFWFLAETAEEEIVAIAGLQAVNYIHGDAVLPMFVAKRMRSKGIGSALTVTLLNLAFDRLRLHRLTTFYRSDNETTHRALQRLGFKEEGRLREGWFADGGRKDVVQVGLLKSEWLEARAGITGGDKVYSAFTEGQLGSVGL